MYIFSVDTWQKPVYYNRNDRSKLRHKFNNHNLIKNNFSQSYQDMFVLSMLDGKFNGTYLEIGSGDPFDSNNTILLESHFGWKGISIEIDENLAKRFADKRRNIIINCDATKVNYEQLFNNTKIGPVFDYLQLDCEPVTFDVLIKIPFNKCKFAVITFEHDYYRDKSIRNKSRKYLKSCGYELIVNNVSIDWFHSYEDWWVHPDLVKPDIVKTMTCINNINKADEYMLGKI